MPATGGISAPVNHRIPAQEIADSLRIVQAKLLVTDDAHRAVASEAAKLANLSYHVITFEEIEAWLSDTSIQPAEPRRLSLEERATTPAFLYFTSGTTGGTKKAACLSHKNAITYAVAMCMVPGGTRALSYTDFHHIGQLTQPCLHGIAGGVTYYVMSIESEYGKAPLVCDAIQKFKIEKVMLFPWLIHSICQDASKDYDLSSLVEVRCAGDTVDAHLLTSFYEKHGIKITPTYSLTEGGYVMAPSWENALKGSSGRPAGSFISVKLVDDHGKGTALCQMHERLVRIPSLTQQ